VEVSPLWVAARGTWVHRRLDMMRRKITVGALVLGGLLRASSASADDGPGHPLSLEEQAQDLEHKAQEAQSAKDVERARALRLQAFSLQANANTALELGRTELELKRYRDSAEHLDYALRMLPQNTSEKTRTLAKKALAEAKAQIAVVQATTNRSGAEIRVDGKNIGRAPLPSSIYLEPGSHEISAHFESNSITRPVVVLGGQEYQLTLPLVSRQATSSHRRLAPAALREQPAPPPVAAPAETSRSPVPLLIGGTVFVAGLASGILFRLDSNSKYQTADELRARRTTTGCVGEQSLSDDCTALRAAAESADRSRNWSTVGFAAAGTALVGTLAYWYWPLRSNNPKQAARLQLTPLVSGSSSGLLLRAEY
jgi:hypothetical protein